MYTCLSFFYFLFIWICSIVVHEDKHGPSNKYQQSSSPYYELDFNLLIGPCIKSFTWALLVDCRASFSHLILIVFCLISSNKINFDPVILCSFQSRAPFCIDFVLFFFNIRTCIIKNTKIHIFGIIGRFLVILVRLIRQKVCVN